MGESVGLHGSSACVKPFPSPSPPHSQACWADGPENAFILNPALGLLRSSFLPSSHIQKCSNRSNLQTEPPAILAGVFSILFPISAPNSRSIPHRQDMASLPPLQLCL